MLGEVIRLKGKKPLKAKICESGFLVARKSSKRVGGKRKGYPSSQKGRPENKRTPSESKRDKVGNTRTNRTKGPLQVNRDELGKYKDQQCKGPKTKDKGKKVLVSGAVESVAVGSVAVGGRHLWQQRSLVNHQRRQWMLGPPSQELRRRWLWLPR